MSNKIFIADYANKVVREKATMEKPEHGPEDFESFSSSWYAIHALWDEYSNNLASLKSYHADWVTKEQHEKELIQGYDFEIGYEVKRLIDKDGNDYYWHEAYWKEWSLTEPDNRRIIALPSQPEQTRGQEEGLKENNETNSIRLAIREIEKRKSLHPNPEHPYSEGKYVAYNDAIIILQTILNQDLPTPNKLYEVLNPGGKWIIVDKETYNRYEDENTRRITNPTAPTPVSSEEGKELTEKQFCYLYTQFHGEEIDKIKQLVSQKFTGEELYEFAKYIVSKTWQSLSSESSGAVEEDAKEICDEIIDLIDEYFPGNEFKEHLRDCVHSLRDETIFREQDPCLKCGKSLREQMQGCNIIYCYRQHLIKKEADSNDPHFTPSTPQGDQSLVDFIKENFYTKGQCGEDNEPLTVEQIVASWQSLSSESSRADQDELWEEAKQEFIEYKNISIQSVFNVLRQKFYITRK